MKAVVCWSKFIVIQSHSEVYVCQTCVNQPAQLKEVVSVIVCKCKISSNSFPVAKTIIFSIF